MRGWKIRGWKIWYNYPLCAVWFVAGGYLIDHPIGFPGLRAVALALAPGVGGPCEPIGGCGATPIVWWSPTFWILLVLLAGIVVAPIGVFGTMVLQLGRRHQ